MAHIVMAAILWIKKIGQSSACEEAAGVLRYPVVLPTVLQSIRSSTSHSPPAASGPNSSGMCLQGSASQN